MPLVSENLIAVAATLVQFGGGDPHAECYYRSACNRAYYAAYGGIRARLEAFKPSIFGKKGLHTRLVTVLTAHADPHLVRIGTRLNQLKVRRELADYEHACSITEVDAQQSISRAEAAIEKTSVVPPARWQAIAGLL